MMIDQGIKFLGILIQHTSLSLTRLDLTERGESVNARSCGFGGGICFRRRLSAISFPMA